MAPRKILDLCSLRAERTGSDRGMFSAVPIDDFHPLALHRPSRWERAMAAAIYAFTGQLPERHEIVHGREVLDLLPRRIRAVLQPLDILGVLAPIIAGFKLSRVHDFVHEANRHRDASRVMQRLLEDTPLSVHIPLCAHRERTDIAARRLAPAPNNRAVARVCGLLRMLLSNARVRGSKVNFVQQGPTERAASCMFPSVFQEYASSGEVDLLLATLDQHDHALRAMIAPYSGPDVNFDCIPLDPLSAGAEEDLLHAFGHNWFCLDESESAGAQATWQQAFVQEVDEAPMSSAFGRVVLHEAVDHVKRLMPEVGAPSSRWPARRSASEAGAKAIEWFDKRRTMSRVGRALFELAFYRRWALSIREIDGIGLGFDRDFSRFQRSAWSLAFGAEADAPVPLLYARRTLDMQPGRALRHLSYRQFWVGESAASVSAGPNARPRRESLHVAR